LASESPRDGYVQSQKTLTYTASRPRGASNPTKGSDIPVEARIISIADVYDSLVSDRPYPKGISPFEARDTIVNGSGKDFDPGVVKTFESAFRKQQMDVPEVLA
jgi:HD-GYP domain-containing protein (c-di-GMP phosphodiesterase class II)